MPQACRFLLKDGPGEGQSLACAGVKGRAWAAFDQDIRAPEAIEY